MSLLPHTLALSGCLSLVPTPHDKHGWALRIDGIENGPVLLPGESLGMAQIHMRLTNVSRQARFHDPLVAAISCGDLQVELKALGHILPPTLTLEGGERDPFTGQHKVKPFESTRLSARLIAFGHHRSPGPGTYDLALSMMIDGKKTISPTVTLRILDQKDERVLDVVAVPKSAQADEAVPRFRRRTEVIQLEAAGHTYLAYRRYEDKQFQTTKIRLIPGKVALDVQGSFGEDGPITVTYQETATLQKVKLVLSSFDGYPWTEEQENVWRNKLKAKEKDKK